MVARESHLPAVRPLNVVVLIIFTSRPPNDLQAISERAQSAFTTPATEILTDRNSIAFVVQTPETPEQLLKRALDKLLQQDFSFIWAFSPNEDATDAGIPQDFGNQVRIAYRQVHERVAPERMLARPDAKLGASSETSGQVKIERRRPRRVFKRPN